MNPDHLQTLLADLEQDGVSDHPAVRVAWAVALFSAGSVSAGYAARVADRSLGEMLSLLSGLGIPLTGVAETHVDAVLQEMRSEAGWLAK